MILENRQILFTNVALRQAFAWYQVVPNQSDLPPGAISAVTPRNGGGASVSIITSGSSKPREVTFTSSKMMAILLYFCQKQRVPIPRDGDKELTVSDDGLMMTVDYSVKTSAPKG